MGIINLCDLDLTELLNFTHVTLIDCQGTIFVLICFIYGRSHATEVYVQFTTFYLVFQRKNYILVTIGTYSKISKFKLIFCDQVRISIRHS